ncbi:hypothetical protein [Paractinoplanes toevensis]|uniref:Uncharacterized protein n=1 Tax=Paractinoplanes toevensis TaxID=571911 RepID=A0A919T4P5_9ACTN|nr:hypothetical protein [Actinoplanes toevensis]GIM89304.1 hypothetical protein Ato02nite_010970 [Actinoplanes toevensis]
MALIEVDQNTKQAVSLAARMANVSEGEIVRRLVRGSAPPREDEKITPGVAIFADYEGHRVRARFYAPARVEIVDGPLAGQSFGTPTGAARAVVRHYNPSINDNRNGWTFWQVGNGTGVRTWLQSIRPSADQR